MKVELTGEVKKGLMMMLDNYEDIAQVVVTTHKRMEYVAKRLKKLEARMEKIHGKG